MLDGADLASHPPEAAACRQVLPKLSGVFMSNPADSTCSLLIDETILYSWPAKARTKHTAVTQTYIDIQVSRRARIYGTKTDLRRVTCDNSLKTRTAQLSARGTFHESHVWKHTQKKLETNSHSNLSYNMKHIHQCFTVFLRPPRTITLMCNTT